MIIRYLNSFLKTFEGLSKNNQVKTTNIVSELLNLFEKKEHTSKGFGLKKLKKNLWEIRIDLKQRLLFSLKPGVVILVLVGNHDNIRRFLRRTK